MAGECLLAYRRGERNDRARAGAYIEGELYILIRMFLTAKPKGRKR
jgi:hypothetical protein